jgi:hypothetical protein
MIDTEIPKNIWPFSRRENYFQHHTVMLTVLQFPIYYMQIKCVVCVDVSEIDRFSINLVGTIDNRDHRSALLDTVLKIQKT